MEYKESFDIQSIDNLVDETIDNIKKTNNNVTEGVVPLTLLEKFKKLRLETKHSSTKKTNVKNNKKKAKIAKNSRKKNRK